MNDQAIPPFTPPAAQIEPISPEQARALLDAAIAARCGVTWQDEDSGWVLVTGHDYMARLSKGRVNVDFYVDLLGVVTVQERELSPAQTGGRTVIVVLIVVTLGVVYAAARALGWV